MEAIHKELLLLDRSAAGTLMEGMEETLTIHRIGLFEDLGHSLCTTNTIENLNSQLERYLRKIKRWHHSEMRSRWVACALLLAEERMKRIRNYQRLHLLQVALLKEQKIEKMKVA